MAKTCPISKADFEDKAEALTLTINGMTLAAEKKVFSTGSFGWYLNGKITVSVDGKPLSVQVGANFTVVGSKEAAQNA